MTSYLISGPTKFLGFDPGTTITTELDPGLEERALKRGAIQIVERVALTLDETRVVMPRGWNPRATWRGQTKGR